MSNPQSSFVILIHFLLFLGCQKEHEIPDFPCGEPDSCNFELGHLKHFYDVGVCEAETNYKDWNTYARYRIWQNDSSIVSIEFSRVPQGGCEQTETIVLKLKINDIQKPISLNYSSSSTQNNDKIPTARLWTHGGGYDTVTEWYNLDQIQESTVIIDSFDPNKEEITGTFNLYFTIASNSIGKHDTQRPDTLTFLNGTFRAAKYRWYE